jgi:cell division septation protein DedD
MELASATPAKGKFTLHLSTFAMADSANAFAAKFPGAFVIAGDVPGKGMVYRVRYGNFASYNEATAAKESFEKQHGTIALVAAR